MAAKGQNNLGGLTENDRPVGASKHSRLLNRHRRSPSASSASSDSSSSGSESSGSDSSCSGGRRRRRHGGAYNPTVRKAVDDALNAWYNQKFLGYTLGGPNHWSAVPKKLTDMVDKINEFWQALTSNQDVLNSLKQALQTHGLASVASTMTKLGFGKRHVGRPMQKGLVKLLLMKLGHRKGFKPKHSGRRGGDAFANKINTYDPLTKTAVNAGLSFAKTKAPKIVQGITDLYNVYAGVADHADQIDTMVSKQVPAIKSAVNKVTSIARNARATGLGRSGKRAPSARNMAVSKLMREEGLTLGQASKKVSEMTKRGGDL